MRLATLLLVATGCGRVAFDPLGAAGDASSIADARADGATADTSTVLVPGVDKKTQDQGTGTTFTIPSISIQGGQTLVVITHRSIGDTTSVMWGAATLGEDEPVSSYGAGPLYLSIWSTYVASGATANVVVTGSGNNTVQVWVLAIQSTAQPAFDKGASATGTGTTANSGATALTTSATEINIGAVGGDATVPLNGTWETGWVDLGGAATPGLETEVAARRVTSTGLFTANYQNFSSRNWGIGIATYKLQ